MQVIDSVKMMSSDKFTTKCKSVKDYPKSDASEYGSEEKEWDKIIEGKSYDYTFNDGKYYIRTYSPDFVAGTNGKIVAQGSCSTLYLSPDKFKEYFVIE